jgi:hypothetical protein
VTRLDVDARAIDRFERDLARTRAILEAEVSIMLRQATERTIEPRARANTPLGPGDHGRHMKDRWRVGSDRGGVYVANPDPGARTMEFGGRHPVYARSVRTRWTSRGVVRERLGRGDWTWVYQPPRLMITRAIRSGANDLIAEMDRDLGRVFRRGGWGRN